MVEPEPKTWIFQANPNIYDLRTTLDKGQTNCVWSVRQFKEHIHPNDKVHLWLSGADGGLLASGIITTEPKMMVEDTEVMQHYVETQPEGMELRVRLEIHRVYESPLTRTRLLAEPVLAEMQLMRSPQGTNFSLTQKEAAMLASLLEPIPSFNELMRQYHQEHTVYQSVKRGQLYAISGVDESGVMVERLSANDPQKVTYNIYEQCLEKIKSADGQLPFSTLDGTAAIRTTILQAPHLALSPDQENIIDVTDTEKALLAFCDHLSTIKVAENKGEPALYQPALVACVIEAIDNGDLTRNLISFDWILPHFIEKMRVLGQSVGADQAALAFYHLSSKPFWLLSYKQLSTTEPPETRTPSSIRQHLSHASLKYPAWHTLQRHAHRQKVLETLKTTWWPNIESSEFEAELKEAFEHFRNDPKESLRVDIRRHQALKIRALLSEREDLTLDLFNREVWAFETEAYENGQDIKGEIFAEPGFSQARSKQLKQALDNQQLDLHGNFVWGSGSQIFGAQLKVSDEEKAKYIQKAAGILTDTFLTPFQKREQILKIPGFGENITTGLIMLHHHEEYAIFNRPSQYALKDLHRATQNHDRFQETLQDLLVTLQADDFLQLDWFLYLISQNRISIGKPIPSLINPDIKYWSISPGTGGRLWNQWKEEGVITVGWDFLGDLRQYNSAQEIQEAIQEHEQDGTRPYNRALASYQFTHEMQKGDYVFAKIGMNTLLGYGVIDSDYTCDPERSEYANIRRVRWLAVGNWDIPEGAWLPAKALTEITTYTTFLNFALPQLSDKPTPPIETPEFPPFSIDEALDGLFLSRTDFQDILNALGRKKNAILQGPPGVGKTFIAKRLAYALKGVKAPHCVEMVQFHQSYAYEDFIQGWRPKEDGGFERKDGVFYDFVQTASKDPENTYVFIIDEINRGNLSKIFGELLMLIEADKRGNEYAVPLTYARTREEKFFIPENLYIIGLMNTADRSLAMVDYALRRRFTFVDLKPEFESNAFRAFLQDTVDEDIIDLIIERLGELNKKIRDDKINLGPGFEIGHSFFCPQGTEEELGRDWYVSVIRSEIAPLIHEYWFDDSDKAQDIIEDLLR